MNKERRRRIEVIIDELLDLKDEVESIRDEEQESYDNLPESIQGGGLGEIMEDNIQNLDCSIDYIDNVIEELESARDR